MLIQRGANVRIVSLDDPARKPPGTEFMQIDLRYFDQALPLLNKAIKKEPSFIEAYEVKSVIFSLQAKYSEAIAVLEEGLALNPNHIPRLHCDLAELYFKTQQYEKGKVKSEDYLKKYHPKSKLRWKATYLLESCKFSIEALKKPDKIDQTINNVPKKRSKSHESSGFSKNLVPIV